MDAFLKLIGAGSVEFLISTVTRLVFALIFGAVIGLEREHQNQPAGLRTHALVCIGAALIMILSDYMFMRNDSIDPARMGAQVISGIGFLGAGTIIKEGFSIRGLTTAATLWAVACVGLAIGAGFYVGALLATLLIYLTLYAVKIFVQRYLGSATIFIVLSEIPETMRQSLELLEKYGFSIEGTRLINRRKTKHSELQVQISHKKDNRAVPAALAELRLLQDVISASYGKS